MMGGVVTDRNDPKRLGRVRVRVPGMFEPSGPWARPMTVGGGGRNSGVFAVPQLGADVGVFFRNGNPDEPYYIALNWGIGEVPDEAFSNDGLDPDTVVHAYPGFRIEVSGAENARKLRLTNQKTGDTLTMDQETNEVLLSATTRLVLKAEGEVEIDALNVTINNRPVKPGTEPI
ncbi:MAG: hypothetical protein KKH12_16060 [Gammaproteobacteria bacterium]|nr:hypothetical protein [Gammaproteobacteria bacterium]